jgi:hypothetical protein
MQGIIRTPERSMLSKKALVAGREGNSRLGMVTSAFQISKWVPLAPGEHLLSFAAVRSSGGSHFTTQVALAEDDVLIAVCEPIQPWTIFGKSPLLDHWYLGVIPVKQQDDDKIGHASGARAQR